MGYANFNPFKNWAQGVGSTLKNIFKPPAPTQQWNSQYVPEQNIPTSYQVKSGDTFASIGAQFNMNETKLQDMNKMVVPPPKGSWITVRPKAEQGANSFTSGDKVNVGNTQLTKPTVQQLINQGVPPSVAAQMAGSQTTGTPAFQTGTGANSFTSGANVNLGELTFNMQNQIANGIAPKNVPGQLLNSLGATPESMAANGYVLNPANNTWQLGGAGGATNNDNDKPDPYSEVRSVYYSKSRGYVTPEVAALLNKKKRMRADAPKGPTTFATNAGGTPVNTLDVRVRSG